MADGSCADRSFVDHSPVEDQVAIVVRAVKAAAEAFKLDPAEVLGRRRLEDIAIARHMVCAVLRAKTSMSFPEIGRVVGRNHGAVLRGIRSLERKMAADVVLAATFEKVLELTGGIH